MTAPHRPASLDPEFPDAGLLPDGSGEKANEGIDSLGAARLSELGQEGEASLEVAGEPPVGSASELASVEEGLPSTVFKDCVFEDAVDVSVSVDFDRLASEGAIPNFHGCEFLPAGTTPAGMTELPDADNGARQGGAA